VTFWEWIDRSAERRHVLRLATVNKPGFFERIIPEEFRGWLALALFIQTTLLFAMIAAFPDLQTSQGFMTLASAVIVTGWIGGAAAFAYAAGKSNAERSEQLTTALRIADNAQPTKEPDVTLKPGETAQAETTNDTAARG
jgi:flagellar biosynthesis protein FliR